MKKCLIMICGLQRSRYHECYKSWFKNLIQQNENVHFDTVLSFDSTGKNKKYPDQLIESWDETQENVKKFFSDSRWGKVTLVDFQVLKAQTSLQKLGFKFNLPECGPHYPPQRIINIHERHINLNDYDFCFYIRPDAELLNKINLHKLKNQFHVLKRVFETGGGYFINGDWDWSWYGDTQSMLDWVYKLNKLNDGSTDIIKNTHRYQSDLIKNKKLYTIKDDKDKRWYIDGEPWLPVVLIEKYLFYVVHTANYEFIITEAVN